MATGKSFNDGSGIKIRAYKDLAKMQANLYLLADVEVLVGFPEDTTDRQVETGKTDAKGKPILSNVTSNITNAQLAYIHDNGAPEANIPARPFMIPAITENEDKIAAGLSKALRAVVSGGAGPLQVEQYMHQVGFIAKLAIQNKINEGIPPPLADSTLRMKAAKDKKGAGIELLSRSMGHAPSMDFVKPLIDTGQLRNAANYVIRSRKKRR